MMDQSVGDDFAQQADVSVELETNFGEPITIRRFTSRPAQPGALMTAQKQQYTDTAATAILVSQNVASAMFAADAFQAGDIVLQMRDRLGEGNGNIGGSSGADRVIWRGAEYRMVQRTQPDSFGAGDPFYTVLLRRTNATTDTVGA